MWSVKLVVWLRRLVATFSGTVPEPMRLGHFRVSLLTIKASATKTSWTLAPNLLPTCGERIAWTCHYYCMVHVVWPKQDTAWQLETTYLWDSPQSIPCPWRIPTGPSSETSARTSPRNALGPSNPTVLQDRHWCCHLWPVGGPWCSDSKSWGGNGCNLD